jgi:HNH endonuclease
MNWEQLRLEVLERDNYVCQNCFKEEANEIHHIIPRRKGGLDTLNNLTTFCRKCHCIIEPKRGERIFEESSSIRVSHKLRSRLAKIRARITLKDDKEVEAWRS